MLSKLKQQLLELGELELQISATGRYKDKRATRVQDVAVYQNDGTKNPDGSQRIKPSKFVQRAERRHRAWIGFLQRATGQWLSGNKRPMDLVGRRMARDINNRVDRIDTRRLMHSFRHELKKR
jgi:hypothetical protein